MIPVAAVIAMAESETRRPQELILLALVALSAIVANLPGKLFAPPGVGSGYLLPLPGCLPIIALFLYTGLKPLMLAARSGQAMPAAGTDLRQTTVDGQAAHDFALGKGYPLVVTRLTPDA